MLPPSLQSFFQYAPALPPGDPSLSKPASTGAPPAAPANALPLPAAPVKPLNPEFPKGEAATPLSTAAKISAEFDAIDPAPLPSSTPSASSFASPVSSAVTSSLPAVSLRQDFPEEDIVDAVDGVRAAARKAVNAQEQTLEMSSRTYSSFVGLRQRLVTEKISLEATVSNAIAANNETASKLEQVYQDIEGLQSQLQELRGKLVTLSSSRSDGLEKLVAAEAEKVRLLSEIDASFKELSETNRANDSTSTKVRVLLM